MLITKKETKKQQAEAVIVLRVAPLHPIRIKTKTKRESFAQVFLRFESGTCIYFEF